jgi:hypothetical protein
MREREKKDKVIEHYSKQKNSTNLDDLVCMSKEVDSSGNYYLSMLFSFDSES